jgi:LEA14-like dessication related protein
MLIACFVLAAAAAPVEITVDPRPGASFVVSFAGPAPRTSAGDFHGSVSLYGSPAEMPLVGRAETRGGLLRLSATLRYADVPADWLNRFRRDTFDYRVRADVAGGESVSWSGTERWTQVTTAGGNDALQYFVKLASLELTSLSLTRSEGRAVLAITNPFSFPITIAAASYRLSVDGEEVGAGGTRGRILRPRHLAGLELPFTVQQWRFLAAAGGQWAAGADVEAEIEAALTFRLPTGDLSIALRLPGSLGTDGARSGVFSHPDGATSLSPH